MKRARNAEAKRQREIARCPTCLKISSIACRKHAPQWLRDIIKQSPRKRKGGK